MNKKRLNKLECAVSGFLATFTDFSNTKIEFVISRRKKTILVVKDQNEDSMYLSFENVKEKVDIYEMPMIDDRSDVIQHMIQYVFLRYLEAGYQVEKVDFEFHQMMWEFFEYAGEVLLKFPYGMRKYLTFCEKNGIHEDLIQAHTNVDMHAIYELFPTNDMIQGITYSHIRKCEIGAWSVWMNYEGKILAPNLYRIVVVRGKNMYEVGSTKIFDEADKLYLHYLTEMISSYMEADNNLEINLKALVDGKADEC